MKWIYRFLTLGILIGALVLPFFIDNQQGEPMLSLPSAGDLIPSQIEQLPIPNPNTTTVYKWQDDKGVWHYGDVPPEGQANISTIEVNSNTNLIQGNRPPPQSEMIKAEDGVPAEGEDFLTLERARNVLKDAKLAAKAMEERNEQLKTLVGEDEK